MEMCRQHRGGRRRSRRGTHTRLLLLVLLAGGGKAMDVAGGSSDGECAAWHLGSLGQSCTDVCESLSPAQKCVAGVNVSSATQASEIAQAAGHVCPVSWSEGGSDCSPSVHRALHWLRPTHCFWHNEHGNGEVDCTASTPDDQRYCPCTGSAGNSCGDYGVCSASSPTVFKCVCRDGWSGDRCDHATGCDDSQACSGHGSCSAPADVSPGDGASFQCACTGEWGGVTCSELPCQNHNDCGEHGTCADSGDSHTCECHDHYIGDLCQHAPCHGVANNGIYPESPDGGCNSTLLHNQKCTPNCTILGRNMNGRSPDGWFLTHPGYRECRDGRLTANAQCAICREDICAHMGQCLARPHSHVDCNCTTGWNGRDCTVEDPCLIEHPCRNGGNCSHATDSDQPYKCSCPKGYMGQDCNVSISVWDTACCASSWSRSCASSSSSLICPAGESGPSDSCWVEHPGRKLDNCDNETVAARTTAEMKCIESPKLCGGIQQHLNGGWLICYGPQKDPQPGDSVDTSWVVHRAVPDSDLIAKHKMCDTFSATRLIVSLLVSTLCIVAYTWAFLRSTSMQPASLSLCVAFGLGFCAMACTVALCLLAVRLTKEDQFHWEYVASCAALALISEIGIAMLWHSQRRHCSRFRDSVSNRLWRGAMTPMMATLAGFPAAAVYLVQAKAERLDLMVEHVWSVLSFGVLVSLLPVAVVFCRTYDIESLLNREFLESESGLQSKKLVPLTQPEPESDSTMSSVTRAASPESLTLSGRLRGGEFSQFSLLNDRQSGENSAVKSKSSRPGPHAAAELRQLLEAHQIFRVDLFLWAQRGYARLSALIPFAFWLAYMANEMQIFLYALERTRHPGSHRPRVSADGIRALNPVVVALNIALLVALFLAVMWFPAPQKWSPFAFFGLMWSLLVGVMVLLVTMALVWSLSEPQREAIRRDSVAKDLLRSNMLRVSFASLMQNRSRIKACFQWLTSWHGQTLLSTVNHLFAIGLFVFGIHEFASEIPPTKRSMVVYWLLSGVALSGLGLLVSAASIVQRKWPSLKYLPTDDSFRLACVLKIALVMTKSTLVFLLATIDGKNEAFKLWELIVSVVSYVSLLVLALVTIAFAAAKVWSRSELLVAAGVAHPHTFIVQYGVSFLCSKCATVFFMLQGHVPDLSGCKPERVLFPANVPEMNSAKMRNLITAEAINCTICFPDRLENASRASDPCRWPGKDGRPFYNEAELLVPEYVCETSCTRLFFSGGGGSSGEETSSLSYFVPDRPTLVVFVLAPLLWLPFTVYANNEVAQLIDGLWFTHNNNQASGSMRIGLSTSAVGYYTIAPLVQAVTLVCVAIVLMFMWTTGGVGYRVEIPDQLTATDAGTAASEALNIACPAVTAGTLVLGLIMLLRVLTEIATSSWEGRKGGDNSARKLDVPLLEGGTTGVQDEVGVVAPSTNGGVVPTADAGDGAATAVGVMIALLAGAE